MKLIGFKRSDFTTKEGTTITGYNLYLTYPLAGDEAAGVACEKCYMTDSKLARSGYTPHVGDEVNVSFNRFGKAENIVQVK